MLLLLFAVFIAPVVYCYYLQYNLHPEIMVRGKDHINGVKFILLNQSVERFSGGMGGDAKNDYFFFCIPFSGFCPVEHPCLYGLLAGRLRFFLHRKDEWLTTGVFIVILLIVSFSGFKLPHYLNIVFPATAVMALHVLSVNRQIPNGVKLFLLFSLFLSFFSCWLLQR
ncbi:MAG: hypothetical protein IPP79_01210 [Chitinophagaceae bacterium]|nr:hypothetical protein [Chitinophagaceae bacterium]